MATTREATGPFAGADVHAELQNFLARESELIDNRAFKDWLDLVVEDFTYRMPVPITPDSPDALHYEPNALVINETRETLIEHWFARFEPELWEMAWAENPPVRYRHFITNVRVRETAEADVYDVRSNAIVSATRQADQPTLLVVERFDEIARYDGAWKLKTRFVVTDATVLDFAQLRVVF